MRSWILCSVVGALCMATGASRPARAQVNVEPFRQRLAEEGATLVGRFRASGRDGNTRGVELGASLLTGLSRAPALVYLAVSGDYAQHDGVTTLARSFAHLRYNHALSERVVGEAFLQWGTDRFRRLTARGLLGLGPRFVLANSELGSFHYGSSAMLELSRRSDAVHPRDREVTALRWNNYLVLSMTLHERVQLSQTVYYQPRFDRFRDFWLLIVTGAAFEVTGTLASRLDFSLRREALVPDNVEPVDVELSSSLELSW